MTKEIQNKLQGYAQRLGKIIQTKAENYAERLRSNDPSLTEIDLVANNIKDAGVKHLAEALKVNQTLTKINLAVKNNITAIGAKDIAEALKVNQTLKWIDLENNSITATGAKDIAEALKVNQSLTLISLQQNSITAIGAKDIAEALKVNQSLMEVHLGYNQMTDTGAKDIAEALKVNQSLTWIDLECNRITDTGAKDIAEALKVNQTLTWIDLGSNKITDTGAKDLAEALKVNKTLMMIDLWGNNITDTGAKDLLEALKFNKTLTQINLSDNNISTDLVKQITDFLSRNKQAAESQKTLKTVKQEQKEKPEPIQLNPKLPISLQTRSLKQLVKQMFQTPESKGDAQLEESAEITPQTLAITESMTISSLKQQQISQLQALEDLTQSSTFPNQTQLKKLQESSKEALKIEEAMLASQETAHRNEITQELVKLKTASEKLQTELSQSKTKSQSEIDQIKFQIENNSSQITDLTTNQQILINAHQKQQQITKEKNQIISNPLTFIFYNTVLKNLEATLLSYRLTSQGIVERKASGGTITKVIDFIGDSIPVPGASFVAGLISLGVKKVESVAFKKKEQAIDDLTNSISQIQDLAERTARSLTLRYEEQLGNLTTASSAELAKIAVKDIILDIYTKQNERIIIEALIESLVDKGSDLAGAASGNNVITTAILTQILESDQIGKTKDKLANYLTEKFQKLKTPEERQIIIDGIVSRAERLNLNQNQNQENTNNPEINQMDQLIDNIANDLVGIVLEDHQDNIMDYLDNPPGMLAKKAKELGSKVVKHLSKKEQIAETKAEDNQPAIATNAKITTKWTAKGIFQEAGIKTKEGEYYSAPKEAATARQEQASNIARTIASKPEIYGYRLGTKEEAQKLNLSTDPNRIRSEVTEISLTKATNQQVQKLGDEAKGNKEETELLRRQLKQAKDQQAQQAKQIEQQEREKAEIKEKQEEMRRKLSLQGKQMAELTEFLKSDNNPESKLPPHHESDSEEFDEEVLKDAIKTGFCDKIKELNLEDKLGMTDSWQIMKHAKKDAFKLVLNVADFQKRLTIKNELSAREIDVKIDAIKKTVSIENIDGSNLDELLVKLESSNTKTTPAPSPKSASATRTKQQQDSILNEF